MKPGASWSGVGSILLATLAAVGTIMLLEGAARITETVRDDLAQPRQDWYVVSPHVGWTPRPGFEGETACATRARFDAGGFRDFDSAQIADRSKTRVLYLGDEITFGSCVSGVESFVERIDQRLADVDHLNLGVIGYSSFQGWQMLRNRGDGLAPDALVISFNYNDRRAVVGSSARDSRARFARLNNQSGAYVLMNHLTASYVVRGMHRLIEKRAVARPVVLDELQPRVALADYRRNLLAMEDWAAERGIPVVFVAMGDNPARTERLRRGVAALAQRDLEASIADLRVAERDPVLAPLARRHLVAAYRGLGRDDDARRLERVTLDHSLHGGPPIRLDSDYIDVMLQIGKIRDRPVVDARKVLRDGDYLDSHRFDAEGHRRLADAVGVRVAELIGEGGAWTTGGVLTASGVLTD